jgi:hypothetical protein
MSLRRDDWTGLGLEWLAIAAAAIEQAERVYSRSLEQRDERFERARDALVQRLREERQWLGIEHAILEKLASSDRRRAA